MKKRKISIIDNGIVYRNPKAIFGYGAWPSVAKNENGELMVAFSGQRVMHICPFGKVILRISKDEGKNWSAPVIAIDTPLDDRDAGILNLGGGKLLLSTFNNSRDFQRQWATESGLGGTPERAALAQAYLPNVSDEVEDEYLGSLLSISEDNGYSWGDPYRVPVTAPHGPNLLQDGALIYAGTPYIKLNNEDEKECQLANASDYPISVYRSENHRDFVKLADIPICPELGSEFDYCEPHIIQLPSGRLVLHIRADEIAAGIPWESKTHTIVQTVSDDGGKTWSTPKSLGCKNCPPHLMLHSSGTLICSYGRRVPNYGVEVMFSDDEAENWDMGYAIWDEGLDLDLGYPCSVELDNGDIFTVYYGKLPGDTMASILWTRWKFTTE